MTKTIDQAITDLRAEIAASDRQIVELQGRQKGLDGAVKILEQYGRTGMPTAEPASPRPRGGDPAPARARRGETTRNVLDLAATGRDVTALDVSRALGISRGSANQKLSAMTKAGKLVRTGQGIYRKV